MKKYLSEKSIIGIIFVGAFIAPILVFGATTCVRPPSTPIVNPFSDLSGAFARFTR